MVKHPERKPYWEPEKMRYSLRCLTSFWFMIDPMTSEKIEEADME